MGMAGWLPPRLVVYFPSLSFFFFFLSLFILKGYTQIRGA
jgi:hypothetical protein